MADPNQWPTGTPAPPPESAFSGGSTPPPPPESTFASNVPPPPPESSFVPASQRVDAHGNHPNMFQAGLMDLANSAPIKDAVGAFQSASLNGFSGLVARHIYTDVLGVPKDRVNAAVTSARQDAAQQQSQNAQNVNVLGHQVDPLAFASGVVGGVDPTYAINPVEGGVKLLGLNAITNTALRATARAGAHIAGQAALNASSDAAYQGADILDGLQQNFDVDRTLHAAELGAGFGTAMHVLGAAPHIKQLFKQRNGVDTTPGANPTGDTVPLSDQGLSTPQAADYAELLKTGSQQDIHNFFNNKNVVPPTHADINDFVNRRDGNTPLSDLSPDDLSKTMLGTPDNRQVVQDHVNQLTENWANKPDVEVINHTDDIQDPKVQAEAKAANADDPNALGFYGSDDKVRLFASKMTSAEDVNAALFHESLGHAGLAERFGDRLDSTLNTLTNRNVGQFGQAVQAELKANGAEYGNNPTRAAEEVLANMSEKGPLKPAISDALESQVRQFGRKMGIDLAYNDAEVRNILAMVHDAKINGNGRDVAANGFSKGPGEPLQTNHAPEVEQGSAVPPPPPEEVFQGPAHDGFQTPQELASKDAIPTTAEHEASQGPYVAQPHEFPQTKPYAAATGDFQTAKDGFMTKEQIAKANAVPTAAETARDLVHNPIAFMKRSDIAADKDYVAQSLDHTFKVFDENYIKDTRSFAEIQRSALEAGFKPSQIKDLGGVGDLSVKLHRLQSAANMLDSKLAGLEAKLETPTWSLKDKGDYMQALADHDYIVQRVLGTRSEIGRALNVSKMATSYSLSTMKAVAAKLRDEGSGIAALADGDANSPKFMKFALQLKALREGGNPAGAQKLIAGVSKPYWEQYVNSFHFNAMLSALSTHVKAPVDMGTGILRESLEKALAIPIGAARVGVGKLAGHNLEAGVSPHELAIDAYGMGKAIISGEVYKQMTKAALNGEGGYVGPDGQFKPVNVMNQYGSTSNPDLGPVLSLPSHLVSAQDIFFRSVAMNKNMYALALRQAKKELPGGSFDDLNTRASALAHTPTDVLLNQARDITDRSLLLNNNPINDLFGLNKLRTYGPNMTVGQRVGAIAINTLAPFIRVESNSLINRVVQRSPLAIFDPYTINVLKAGGPQADIALAKIAYGTATLGLAWAGAKNLTGNLSSNPAKKQELEAGGELPKAIHEDGHYDQSSNLAMSLFPWDQHNATAQIVKEARVAFESKGVTPQQKMVGLKLALESVTHNLADMSWVSSTQPALDALSSNEQDGPGKVARFVGDEAKTFVPNILNQTERLTDNKRNTRPDDPTDISGQVANDVKSAIPGLSGTLPVKHTVYGDPTPTGATPEGVHNFFGRGNNTTEVSDPTEKELNRLAQLTPAAVISPTPRTLQIEGTKVQLTTAQAEEYQEKVGKTIVEASRSAMANPNWSQSNDKDKISYVKEVQKEARSQIKESLLQTPGWLNSNQLDALRTYASGKR